MLQNKTSVLEKQGKLRKHKVSITDIEALLCEATLDLKEAKQISAIAKRSTYLLAYTAMLKAGRALLLMKGYIPAGGAQHKTVVEITAVLLGEAYRNLTDHFENMRRKRNALTYQAGTLLTFSEAQKAFSDAIDLVKGILKEVRSQNPQLEFEFDLD